MEYNVKIDLFEGPLDLLLHLINRYEINIYDIPVKVITEQYLFYIHTMKELQLDVASEYLVMAATLLAIKSKMLLPPTNNEEDDEELFFDDGEDPRDALVEQLLEYKKYKEAATVLKEKEEERGLLFTKAPSDLSDYTSKESITSLAPLSVYDLIGAYQKLLRRKKLKRPLQTTITKQDIPIEERMNEILKRISKSRTRFEDLFPYEDKFEIVITFLSILELMKTNKIHVEQQSNFSSIYIVRN